MSDEVRATRHSEGKTVLGKVVSVLQAFTAEDYSLSLAELTRRTAIPKGTLHRILADLVAVRLLDRVDDRYRLGGQLFELGMRASVGRRLLEVATPFMQDLFQRSHETVQLGVLEGIEVVYVLKIGGHGQVPSPSRIGGRMPLYCTAIGKALLAFSPEALTKQVIEAGLPRKTARTITGPGLLKGQLLAVREGGVAYEYEESATGVVCVASPVLGPSGRPVAAVSLTGPVTRFSPQSFAVQVRAAAGGIASTLADRDAMRAGDGPLPSSTALP